MPGEHMLKANGIDLCVQQFGDAAHPTILLVHGASASMLWWPEEFCERLANGRRHVVRFDNRDTGRSTSYPPGEPRYAMADMARDAIGVLDALGIADAHLVGRSMAGGIVSLAALLHPQRVASLTLVSTTTGGQDLPGMAPEFLEYTASRRPDPSDADDVVDFIVGLTRQYAGDSPYFDADAMRRLAERDVARADNIASTLVNHFVIDVGMPEEVAGRAVEAPVLIVHGELDPVFPLPHAEATRRRYPGSELVVLPRTGHDVPPQTWDIAVPALLRHTSGGWEAEEDRIISAALDAGDAVGWFETLYQAGAEGSVNMPWSRSDAHPLLADWADGREREGAGRSAMVVGCGLGADAEFVSRLGFDTTAFDVSPTAVRVARQRHDDSTVSYTVADLLQPPANWEGAFDLVVEIITVQALPRSLRPQAIANVARMVAPGGTLFVVAAIAGEDATPPPWPLTRSEVESFADGGLEIVGLESTTVPGKPQDVRWRAEFRRPG
ncbi:MAG TPA: alpha/beta fold hydrolase [Stackebrandtia sp.]|jgi:pimeloyl-ACP methyl ester carboxylesterase|uniref:alpha/beta fold hydrolase n=1 Tax=Stackebrandtia sp. TaxID=2023065 RepID=UPI002D63770E|nr:alpha/beta fold hydrolase [Stackebrandtia sp.]HZE38245.1 alpha/beta fold hydrolase [Stackebrandtia sp.]